MRMAGVALAFLAVTVAATCTPEARMVVERPPIVDVSIDIGAPGEDSHLVVRYTRRNVCVEPRTIRVTREGDTFTAVAEVFAPRVDREECGTARSVGTYRAALVDRTPFPSSLGPVEQCRTYTVVVNDETYRVQARGPGRVCPPA